MKMSRLISVILLGITLIAACPIYAQRGGGSRGSSSVGSRSSGGSFSRSTSSPSRSSSSTHGRSGVSSSSASVSSTRSSGTLGSSSSSDSFTGSAFSGGLRRSGSASGRGSVGGGTSSSPSRTGSVPTQMRRGQTGAYSRVGVTGREDVVGSNAPRVSADGEATRATNARVGNGRPSGVAPMAGGGIGPRPHHNPYHGNPHYHQIYWDPCPPRPCYWPGFWIYCSGYWYDGHASDNYVVREYVKETYNMQLVAYAISGDYMYALVNDVDGHTYLQIYDKSDKLLAEQQVSRKYTKMEVDAQNGGCWIMKKRGKDALLFLYADGQLLIYEANK